MKWAFGGLLSALAVLYAAFRFASTPFIPVSLAPSQPLLEFLAKNSASGALLMVKDKEPATELYWSWPGKVIDRETLFDLGSLSKQFTGFLSSNRRISSPSTSTSKKSCLRLMVQQSAL